MEHNKTFFALKSTKLSFLARRSKLSNLIVLLTEKEVIDVVNDEIKWIDEMIKGLECAMECAIYPDIPF